MVAEPCGETQGIHRLYKRTVKNMEKELQLSPPESFAGDYDRWDDWSWQLKLYVMIHYPIAVDIMEMAEGHSVSLDDCFMNSFVNEAHSFEYLHEISRRFHYLHYLIVQITTGPASKVVRLGKSGNGFEAWRLLHERFISSATFQQIFPQAKAASESHNNEGRTPRRQNNTELSSTPGWAGGAKFLPALHL